MSSLDGFEMLKNWQIASTAVTGTVVDAKSQHFHDERFRVVFVDSTRLDLLRIDSGATLAFDLKGAKLSASALRRFLVTIKLHDRKELTLREEIES